MIAKDQNHPSIHPTMNIKFLHPDAMIPSQGTPGASGYDLYACRDHIIEACAIAVIPTGIALEIPYGLEAQVRPRSGLAAKSGIVAILGTIDSDYRGEVSAILHNTTDMHFMVKKGSRIAQLVFANVCYPQLTPASSLDQTTRAANGFGSTGV